MKKSDNVKNPFDRNIEQHLVNSSRKGVNVILDTLGFRIQESFVVKDKLRHIYSDDNGTYIGEIKEEKIKELYKFDFLFHSYYNHQTEDGKHILTIVNPKDNTYGILTIYKNELDFHFLK